MLSRFLRAVRWIRRHPARVFIAFQAVCAVLWMLSGLYVRRPLTADEWAKFDDKCARPPSDEEVEEYVERLYPNFHILVDFETQMSRAGFPLVVGGAISLLPYWQGEHRSTKDIDVSTRVHSYGFTTEYHRICDTLYRLQVKPSVHELHDLASTSFHCPHVEVGPVEHLVNPRALFFRYRKVDVDLFLAAPSSPVRQLIDEGRVYRYKNITFLDSTVSILLKLAWDRRKDHDDVLALLRRHLSVGCMIDFPTIVARAGLLERGLLFRLMREALADPIDPLRNRPRHILEKLTDSLPRFD